MRVATIVPYLPDQREGVGDYAEALADALRTRFGLATEFLVGASLSRSGGGAQRKAALGGSPQPDVLASLEASGAPVVLLHYAGYGYSKRGCPTWLASGLGRWKRGGAGKRRLVTIFHEVYASGPPWRSSFWLSPVQRRVAASLVRSSDALITSLGMYRDLLRPWAADRAIQVMPVFSTVSESLSPPPLAARRRRLIVFGGAGRRRAAYRARAVLMAACDALQIEEIVDIGPETEVPSGLGALRVRRAGVLPAAEVCALLRDSAAGFLAYPPRFLPKSTIFAAYCAHGLLPVCAPGSAPGGLEVREAEHYWRADSGRACDHETGQRIAAAAHGWYFEHSLALQTEALMTSLQ